MPILGFTIEVPDVDSVLQHFDRIRVFRSTAGTSGPFTEITDAQSRVVIEQGQTLYEFYDLGGDPSFHYQVDYINTRTGRTSQAGAVEDGSRDAAFSVISVQELKDDYLFGLDLTDDRGNPFPNKLFERYIKSAVAYISRRLDVPLRRKVYSDINPAADEGARQASYFQQEWYSYFHTQLPERPIISVESARIVFPNGRVGFDFPPAWFRLDRESGQLWIVPDGTVTNLPALGLGFIGWLPLAHGTVDWVPGIYQIEYTAGLDPVPEDVKHLVAMQAAIGVLNIAGDLIVGAGIANTSLSLDGLSQTIGTTSSATNAGYGARIGEYKKEIKEQLPEIRRALKGIGITVA